MGAECLDLPRLCATRAHLDSLRVLNHLREPLFGRCGPQNVLAFISVQHFKVEVVAVLVVPHISRFARIFTYCNEYGRVSGAAAVVTSYFEIWQKKGANSMTLATWSESPKAHHTAPNSLVKRWSAHNNDRILTTGSVSDDPCSMEASTNELESSRYSSNFVWRTNKGKLRAGRGVENHAMFPI